MRKHGSSHLVLLALNLILFLGSSIECSAQAEQAQNRISQPVGGIFVRGFTRRHDGVDIGGNADAPVYSAYPGEVVEASSGCPNYRSDHCNGGFGNLVQIYHAPGMFTNYAHLTPGCALPRVGSQVTKQTQIGCVGTSGHSTGPHLHFELIVGDHHVDPMNYLGGVIQLQIYPLVQ